ncbi:discoidin domain-containing protein [Rubellicoccus peritrichatus]|uniref:Discoidin domain-containing protein n=1 Tax=Rubellicoccus peritrichatus TaxID=3080537 RepID=A0AAQ3QPS0_9BACT|nr:discoidin domain-containing protein [Puniceicoccus sp. CR14]WOO39383.1 discoidin domain-containing protein [Puniceicoccus sp. CR14]
MNKQFDSIDGLIWKYLDGSITEPEFDELQQLLKEDEDYRRRYQLLTEIHNGLDARPAGEVSLAQESLPATRSTGKRSFLWLGGIAAVILFMLLSLTIFSEPKLDVILSASREADWRGADLQVGEQATTRIMHLMGGAIALKFPGKTSAIIEGPALFQIQNNETIELSSGTITVHHEGKPGDFRVITPVGRFTDLGTKFGIAVGNGVKDSVVMAEVYEGEVVFDNYENTQVSFTDGDAYAIVGDNEHQVMLADLDGEQVKVTGMFELSSSGERIKSTDNLALGKPVIDARYYNSPKHGEVFPPSALTDNRLNDSGSPWNWSFWLAPDGEAGRFTLDLLDVYSISRIELLNTRNRHYDDRGIDEFFIEVSSDGEFYEPLLEGRLQRIPTQDEQDYQFEVFSFDPVQARYIRLTGKSHHSERGIKQTSNGGGLNEIRVFE